MRKPLALALIIGVAGCATSTTGTREAARELGAARWRVVKKLVAPHTVTMAAFHDLAYGVTVGTHGEIHYTADGGATWAQAVNHTHCRLGVDVLGPRLSWHIGIGGNPGVSEDGGATWELVSKLPYTGRSAFISFIDRKTGWIATNSTFQMWSTRDGGASWQELTVPEGMAEIINISLLDAEHGYVVDSAETLYVTADGGASWVARALPAIEAPAQRIAADHAAAMRFFDARRGVVASGVFDDSGTRIVMSYTNDGGENWTREVVEANAGKLFFDPAATFLTVSAFNNPAEIELLQAK